MNQWFSDSVIQWYRTVKVISDTVKWISEVISDSVIQWHYSIQWYSDTQRYIILSQWYSDSQWYIILSSDYLNQFINPACDHQEITAPVRDHQEITAPVRDHPSNRQRVCVTSLADHVSTLVIMENLPSSALRCTWYVFLLKINPPIYLPHPISLVLSVRKILNQK